MRRPLGMFAEARMNCEKLAYWYLRLNGFFQLENFVVHPERRGGQLTDADLLGVRFPNRAERLFDDPNDLMQDDTERLALSDQLIDIVIAEVKTNQPCTLNGPWTRQDRQNVHRVLAAMGCLPHESIENAAKDIYDCGVHISDFGIRVRLVAVARDHNLELKEQYPRVTQVIWPEICEFIWERFDTFSRQKAQVDQWDFQGQKLKRIADRSGDVEEFTHQVLSEIGVRVAAK